MFQEGSRRSEEACGTGVRSAAYCSTAYMQCRGLPGEGVRLGCDLLAITPIVSSSVQSIHLCSHGANIGSGFVVDLLLTRAAYSTIQ